MLPRVILHNAVSLDGRVDHFTPDVGLFYELAARWGEGATLAGSDTLLAAPGGAVPDDEAAPAPAAVAASRPLLVVPDSRGRVRCWRALLGAGYWRGGVALCTRATPAEHFDYLERSGVDVIHAGEERVDLRAALDELAERHGVNVVRVDSGGTLNGVLLRAGLVHEVSLLLHPELVGGVSPRSVFRAPDLLAGGRVVDLRLVHVERLRDDIVWLRYEVGR